MRLGLSAGPWPGLPWEPIPLPTKKGSQLVGGGAGWRGWLALLNLTTCWGMKQFSLRGMQGYKAWQHQKAWELVFQVGEGLVPTQEQATDAGESDLGVDGSREEEFHQWLSWPHGPVSLVEFPEIVPQLPAVLSHHLTLQEKPDTQHKRDINWLTRTFLKMFRRPKKLNTENNWSSSVQLLSHV